MEGILEGVAFPKELWVYGKIVGLPTCLQNRFDNPFRSAGDHCALNYDRHRAAVGERLSGALGRPVEVSGVHGPIGAGGSPDAQEDHVGVENRFTGSCSGRERSRLNNLAKGSLKSSLKEGRDPFLKEVDQVLLNVNACDFVSSLCKSHRRDYAYRTHARDCNPSHTVSIQVTRLVLCEVREKASGGLFRHLQSASDERLLVGQGSWRGPYCSGGSWFQGDGSPWGHILSQRLEWHMRSLLSVGRVPWSRENMIGKLQEFAALYEDRPVEDNTGGMKAPHMFMAWFILQSLKPKAIVESGVWLGQGTWFFEKACPDADLFCIDPNLDRIRYRSSRATYFDRDFSAIDWTSLPRSETVLFFDDHQNAYERVKTARWCGFRHMIFDDNYPSPVGQSYSLKAVFMEAGFSFPRPQSDPIKQTLKRLLGVADDDHRDIPPNKVDATYLRQNLEVYYECPPVFRPKWTNWIGPWDEEKFPAPRPLLDSVERKYQQIFLDEAAHYNWICYAKLLPQHQM